MVKLNKNDEHVICKVLYHELEHVSVEPHTTGYVRELEKLNKKMKCGPIY